tara:strand:- start:362 stop:562 length:201 start_codon:yes stop_codon:yes gene_type:complete
MSLETVTDSDYRDWPKVSKALIKKLKETFPERCIGENELPQQAHRYAGKTEMIRFLEIVEQAQSGN